MKKIIFVSIFILGMIIPGLNVKATDVSNEEELRAAIQQGGDITLTEDIEVTEPLVIDKDVYIDGYGNDILMQGDNTLLTVNSGNVSLGIVLYAGWNGSYDNFNLVKGQGKAIEVNGGTANLSYKVGLGSSTSGYGIYINKGINTTTKGDVLNLESNFVFGYERGTTPNFSVYVNPDIDELKITDEKEFFELLDNKLNLGFCSNTYSLAQKSEDEKKAICENLNANLDGPIESNELGKCTAVYINGVKQKDADASCNPVTDNKNEPSQVVNVPATSAYASIIIITLGILCVVVSVIVTRRVTRKVK